MSRIEDIKKRREALPRHKWTTIGASVYHENLHGRPVADCREWGDTPDCTSVAEFIAAAPADIDYLLERVAKLESIIAEADQLYFSASCVASDCEMPLMCDLEQDVEAYRKSKEKL